MSQSATLQYAAHQPDPSIICAICLEPTIEDAVRVSCCSDALMCSDCVGHWLMHLILQGKLAKCICGSSVNTEAMKPLVYEKHWEGQENDDEISYDKDDYDMDSYDEESYYEEEDDDDESDLMHEDGHVEEGTGTSTAQTLAIRDASDRDHYDDAAKKENKGAVDNAGADGRNEGTVMNDLLAVNGPDAEDIMGRGNAPNFESASFRSHCPNHRLTVLADAHQYEFLPAQPNAFSSDSRDGVETLLDDRNGTNTSHDEEIDH